jgi:GNAT superfamily N-acetyltransferase
MRLELAARLLESLGDRAPKVTPQEFEKMLADWDLVEANGAVIMIRGNEAHVGALKEHRGKWLSRSVLKRVLGRIIEQHGSAITRVATEHEAGHIFVKRLGFKEIKKTDSSVIYEMKGLIHA